MFNFLFERGLEHLRQPDRAPRCYELTDAERAEKVRQLGDLNGGAHIPKVIGGVAPGVGFAR
jgi:hypothetical protein